MNDEPKLRCSKCSDHVGWVAKDCGWCLNCLYRGKDELIDEIDGLRRQVELLSNEETSDELKRLLRTVIVRTCPECKVVWPSFIAQNEQLCGYCLRG